MPPNNLLCGDLRAKLSIGAIWVVRTPRVLGIASRDRELSRSILNGSAIHTVRRRSFRGEAEINTRDECALPVLTPNRNDLHCPQNESSPEFTDATATGAVTPEAEGRDRT